MSLKGWGMLFLFGIVIGSMVGDLAGEAYGTGTGVRSHPQSNPSQLAKANIPAPALKEYRSADARYGVAWYDLAGIGKVETDHCQANAPGVHRGENYAGAGGCMQFLSGTWARYGHGSRYRLADSIPAAARLLKANGYGRKTAQAKDRRCPGINARPGTINAIRHYNNACWYVVKVLAWSDRYRTGRTA